MADGNLHDQRGEKVVAVNVVLNQSADPTSRPS